MSESETFKSETSFGASSEETIVQSPAAVESAVAAFHASWIGYSTEDEDSVSLDEDSVVPPWSNLLSGFILARPAVRQAMELPRVRTIPDARLPPHNCTRPSYVDATLVHECEDVAAQQCGYGQVAARFGHQARTCQAETNRPACGGTTRSIGGWPDRPRARSAAPTPPFSPRSYSTSTLSPLLPLLCFPAAELLETCKRGLTRQLCLVVVQTVTTWFLYQSLLDCEARRVFFTRTTWTKGLAPSLGESCQVFLRVEAPVSSLSTNSLTCHKSCQSVAPFLNSSATSWPSLATFDFSI